MESRSLQLSAATRLRAEKTGQLDWIAGLSNCVKILELSWEICVGESLLGGSESLVANATRSDGTLAVIKVGLPGTADLAIEAEAYRTDGGRGYAHLLAHDKARNALLLERLGPLLADLDLPVDSQIKMLCSTLQQTWVPVNRSSELMTGAAKAKWLADFIAQTWAALSEPCARDTRDQALRFAAEREASFCRETSVLVHGDAHSYNALTMPVEPDGSETRCKFVDPDGLIAEPAYDLAIPMRDWSEQLLDGDALKLGLARCDLLAELTGVNHQAIWQWGFIERVSTGLTLLQIGMDSEGVAMLAVADQWVTYKPSQHQR